MTSEQQQWVHTLKQMGNLRAARTARMPTHPLRRWLFALVTSRPFDVLILGVVGANVLLMACDYWRIEEDAQVKAWYDGAMLTFSYIYYAEAALKASGLGLHNYFRDSWCRFDFFLVCVLFLDQYGAQGPTPNLLSVARGALDQGAPHLVAMAPCRHGAAGGAPAGAADAAARAACLPHPPRPPHPQGQRCSAPTAQLSTGSSRAPSHSRSPRRRRTSEPRGCATYS